MVRSIRDGRESLFELDPRPIEGAKEYLEFVSEQWDQALGRLKSFRGEVSGIVPPTLSANNADKGGAPKLSQTTDT